MIRISANLGFLFTDSPLPDAIRRAGETGFAAVECHWPYQYDPDAIIEALTETGLPMIGLNTVRGDVAAGDMGLSALPERRHEARAAIDQAIDYADRIGCRNVHVMAGRAQGPEARAAFVENLRYAADRAAEHEVGILVEPLNQRDAPGYLVPDIKTALALVEEADRPSVKVMYDCYHMQIMGGDLLHTVRNTLSRIGHIQFASVPDRAEPDQGEVNYEWLLPAIAALGYEGYFGAEYKPVTGSFRWLDALLKPDGG